MTALVIVVLVRAQGGGEDEAAHLHAAPARRREGGRDGAQARRHRCAHRSLRTARHAPRFSLTTLHTVVLIRSFSAHRAADRGAEVRRSVAHRVGDEDPREGVAAEDRRDRRSTAFSNCSSPLLSFTSTLPAPVLFTHI